MKNLIYILAFLPILVNAQGNFWSSYSNYEVPTVVTHEATAITATSATSSGHVVDDGGANVHTRGVCWNTTGTPTTNDDYVVDGSSGTGSFEIELTGLTNAITYYYRAFAVNTIGIDYGGVKTFTTNSTATTPSVTTIYIAPASTTTVVADGETTDDGGASITEQGFVYKLASSSGDPTTSDSKVTASLGSSTFTEIISGLTENTTYKVRAYAINSEGTAYGLTKEITTEKSTTDPPFYTTVSKYYNLNKYWDCPFDEDEHFTTWNIIYPASGDLVDYYEGEPPDSITVHSVDYDYDGDGYEGFKLRYANGTIMTLPVTLNINQYWYLGLSEQFYIHYYNSNLNGNTVCDKGFYDKDMVAILFSFKDVNGNSGEIVQFIHGVYYNENIYQ